MQHLNDFSCDRFDLYEKLVKKNFTFLVKEYGFSITQVRKSNDSSISIEYATSDVFVRFNYGAPSFELDFYIGRVNIDLVGFNSSDLVATFSKSSLSEYKLFAANTQNNLLSCLPRLAAIFKELGMQLLRGEQSYFEKVDLEKQKRCRLWGDEQELKQKKRAAQAAWNNKDYRSYIEVCEPIANVLSPAELKKLDYARSHY